MSQSATTPTTSPVNGQTSPHDLFLLTDEQILEIEPEVQDLEAADAAGTERPVIPSEARNLSSSDVADQMERPKKNSSSTLDPRNDGVARGSSNRETEPPKWLAEMMADPQAGGEACDFWNGIQQAQSDAKAYRDVFAKPEDARAAAERARTLDEIDAAFYGGAGNSPDQTSAARMQLAQRMMREDPASFREMVFAGLRALESAGNVAPPARVSQLGAKAGAGPQTSAALANQEPSAAQEGQLSAYQSFEKTANEELERSLGGAIERALRQALPSLGTSEERAAGARNTVPLQERLGAAIREDLEASLKSDRQLGEQVAQILSSRRFDDPTRAQVVRLINDRAQLLVPVATKRVINAWTQTTFAAHSARLPGGQAKAPNTQNRPARAAEGQRRDASPARNAGTSAQPRAKESGRSSARPGRVDYARLSDEQILDL